MVSGIYKIICIGNNKYYIGSAKNIHKRWLRHLNDLKNNRHVNILLQRAYNKYGEKTFIIEILENCEEKNLLIREQYYLDKFKPYIDNFNIGKNANGGDNITNHPNYDDIVSHITNGLNKKYSNMTEEQKLKRSINIRGEKNPNYGNKWNDEQRERMSKQRKGLTSKRKGKTYEELYGNEKANKLKEIHSNNMKNRKSPFYGKKHNEKNIKFFSESQKNKPNKAFFKKLKPFIIDDVEYLTLNEASKKLGINYLTIRNRLLSKNFKNYFFIEDQEIINNLKNKYLNLENLD